LKTVQNQLGTQRCFTKLLEKNKQKDTVP